MLFECSQMCFRFAHELIDIYSRHLDPEEVARSQIGGILYYVRS